MKIETEAGTAEEQPARNNLTSGKVMEGIAPVAPSYMDIDLLLHVSENLNKKTLNNNQNYKTVFDILSN